MNHIMMLNLAGVTVDLKPQSVILSVKGGSISFRFWNIVWQQVQSLLKTTPPPGFWRFDLLKAYRKDLFWVPFFFYR